MFLIIVQKSNFKIINILIKHLTLILIQYEFPPIGYPLCFFFTYLKKNILTELFCKTKNNIFQTPL